MPISVILTSFSRLSLDVGSTNHGLWGQLAPGIWFFRMAEETLRGQHHRHPLIRKRTDIRGSVAERSEANLCVAPKVNLEK